MGPAASTTIGLLLLLAVLAWAVARPRRLPEALVAVPAAGTALALGLVELDQAWATLREFGPTLAFLAAVLVLAHLADAEGVFRWVGEVMARGSRGDPVRLLGLVFLAAAATTAVLSLDATVVLLTPVVIATVRRVGVRPDPALYATAHLANTASLLLPVSNLTNLLAFHATGLTFLHFAGLMTLPFLACVGIEYLVLRAFFGADLRAAPVGGDGAVSADGDGDGAGDDGAGAGDDGAGAGDVDDGGGDVDDGGDGAGDDRAGDDDGGAGDDDRVADGPVTATVGAPTAARPPIAPLTILAAVLAGFALAPLAGVPTYLVAVVGAGVMAVPALVRRRIGPVGLVAAAGPLFVLFVAALAVVVDGAIGHGIGSWVAGLLPAGTSLTDLLLLAGISALAANLVNNLPATLVLLAALGPHAATGAVLAVLIGVNIGPDLTYTGSLATLLWRRVLHRYSYAPTLGRFTALGLVTVPACLLAGVLTLWLALQV